MSAKLDVQTISRDTTLQSTRCCFAKENLYVNHTWGSVAKQMLGGSTWNGTGTAAYNGLAALGNLIRAVANFFAMIRYCANPQKRSEHGKKFVASLMFLGTNLKNIAFNAIRAVPIIGYPISRGIEMLAEKFYGVECVANAMTNMIEFGKQYTWRIRESAAAKSLPPPTAPPAGAAKGAVELDTADQMPDDSDPSPALPVALPVHGQPADSGMPKA